MTPANFQVTIRSFIRRKPFRAFVIEFCNGQQIRVGQPEAVRFRGTLAVFIAHDSRHIIFDHESVSRVYDEPVIQAGGQTQGSGAQPPAPQ